MIDYINTCFYSIYTGRLFPCKLLCQGHSAFKVLHRAYIPQDKFNIAQQALKSASDFNKDAGNACIKKKKKKH